MTSDDIGKKHGLETVQSEPLGQNAIANAEERLNAALRHQKFLLSELQHRVRNTFAVIRSIIRRSAESSETVEDFVNHLDGRIRAFARVQLAVTRDPLARFDFAAMISEEMLACAAREGERFTLDGPPVRLRPKAAESVGLAVHELATNAVKHGALSVERGLIDIRWWEEKRKSGAWLAIDWKESGMMGHPVEQKRQGFGTMLLQETLKYDLGAEVKCLFKPTGLHCEIAFPLMANT